MNDRLDKRVVRKDGKKAIQDERDRIGRGDRTGEGARKAERNKTGCPGSMGPEKYILTRKLY